MNKKLVKVIASCLIIGVIGTGTYFGYVKYKSSKIIQTAVNYSTAKVSKTNLQVQVQSTGTVFASITKDISANNGGELKDLNIKEGDIVKQGDKLFQIYNSQLQDQVDKADINLQKQKLQANAAKTETDIEVQNLMLKQAQKDLDNAVLEKDKSIVTSPISGLVVAKNYNNGDDIQSGKPIVSIVDTSSMKIKITVDELDISKIKVGQKAEIKLDAIKNKVYEGSVETISQLGTTENNVTTYDVVVSIKNIEGIKLGMNASVNILVQNKDNALVVPVEALIERNGIKYVRVPENESLNTSKSENENSNTNKSENTNIQQQWSGKKRNAGSNSGEDKGIDPNNVNGQGNFSSPRKINYGSNNPVSSRGNLVKVETGLENEKYVEIISGLSEGQGILINLPKISNTNNTNMRGGGFGENMMGGNNRTQNLNGKSGK